MTAAGMMTEAQEVVTPPHGLASKGYELEDQVVLIPTCTGKIVVILAHRLDARSEDLVQRLMDAHCKGNDLLAAYDQRDLPVTQPSPERTRE